MMCDACHDLDDCSIFMSQTVEDRSEVLCKNKLCSDFYGCVSKDHNARNCKHRRSCKICKEKYPTGLYGFKSKKEGIKKTVEMVTISRSKSYVQLFNRGAVLPQNLDKMSLACV